MATGAMGAGAVRHIVMLKVGDKANVAKVAASLGKLGDGIPGVKWNSFSLHTDLGLAETNYDVALTIDFPDKENYVAYAKHPEHVAAVQSNASMVVSRAAVQFSLAPKL